MADRAFQHIGERQYVEGVPFGGWIEDGDCYVSDAPLWDGDVDLLAEARALSARLAAVLKCHPKRKTGPGPAGGVWICAECRQVWPCATVQAANPTPWPPPVTTTTEADDGE